MNRPGRYGGQSPVLSPGRWFGATAVAFVLAAAGCADGDGGEAAPSTTTTTTVGTSTTAASTTAPPSTVAPPTPLELAEAIGSALAPFDDVPGVAVAVLRDGAIVEAVGFGQDPSTGDFVTAQTRFQVASISKPVTATLAAILAEEGELDWDADIHDALTSTRIPTPYDEPITLSQLLSHTSGASVDGFVGYPADAELPSVLQILAGHGNSDAVEIRTTPGSWAYSGGGYTVVQQAIVDVTAEAFAGLATAQLLDPIGMTRSTFAQPLPGDLWADDTTVGSIEGEPFGAMVHPELAAAGLWSTAQDLAAFVLEFQAALDGRSDVLTAESAEMMIEPVAGGPGVVIGRGWFVDAAEPVRWFWHEGQNVGYNAEIIGSVDGRHGIVVLTNAWQARAAIRAVVGVVAELEGWDGLPR